MSLLKHIFAILSGFYHYDLFILQLQRLSKSSTNPHFVPGKSEIGFCGTDWSDSLLKFPPSHRKAIRTCQIYRGHLSKRKASPSSLSSLSSSFSPSSLSPSFSSPSVWSSSTSSSSSSSSASPSPARLGDKHKKHKTNTNRLKTNIKKTDKYEKSHQHRHPQHGRAMG